MSISQMIAPHLPYLRRYARALVGAQESGDACVAFTLETLVADPGSFPRELPGRVGLYKLFTQIWSGTPPPARPRGGIDGGPSLKLGAMTPRPRQAFLLSAVEGFSSEEVGAILDEDETGVRALLDAASREIAAQVSTDVLIIEDEPVISMDLEALVESLGHTALPTARTRREALEAVRGRIPGLILADIQLADGSSGVDAVNDMLQKFETPVIFVTAYPEHLLSGKRPEPTFLITKPFQAETVRATISQALFFDQRARRFDRLAAV